eukprot:scaffold82247_cov26-Tisochrysis_lutea.AAC.1
MAGATAMIVTVEGAGTVSADATQRKTLVTSLLFLIGRMAATVIAIATATATTIAIVIATAIATGIARGIAIAAATEAMIANAFMIAAVMAAATEAATATVAATLNAALTTQRASSMSATATITGLEAATEDIWRSVSSDVMIVSMATIPARSVNVMLLPIPSTKGLGSPIKENDAIWG